MSYTVGGSTGDDITSTVPTAGGNNHVSLSMGWFYPTTLTATRGLLSYGNTVGLEVDTTTSELRLRTDNTTDGQWTTTGVGLALNKWSFIAFMLTCSNTGPTASWRVWAGSAEQAPVECTVTNAVAPVGNFSSSTLFTIGNKGTGTLAFQGEVGPALHIQSAVANVTTAPFPNNAAGVITQDEADFAFNRIVLPFWSGIAIPPQIRTFGINNEAGRAAFYNLDFVLPVSHEVSTGASATSRTPTINATASQNRGPRRYETAPLHPWPGAPRLLRL